MLNKIYHTILNLVGGAEVAEGADDFQVLIKKWIKPKSATDILIVEDKKNTNRNLSLFNDLFTEEHCAAIEKAKKEANTDHIIYSKSKIFTDHIDFFYTEIRFDVIVVDLCLETNAHGLEVLAYDILYPLLKADGRLIITSISGIRNQNRIKQKLKNKSIKHAEEFLTRHFATHSPDGDDFINKFEACDYFKLANICPSEDQNTDLNLTWFLLKKKKPKKKSNKRVFVPKREAKSFSLNEVEKFFTAMLNAGCKALTSNAFFEAVRRGEATGRFLVKHDIHKDLRRTMNFAELEFDMGIRSVYFAIPDHELTKKYFGSAYMWRVFERISSMNHEIALHLDLHDLIFKYGSIEKGIEETKQLFMENGFDIKTANLHGNTKLRAQYGSPKAFIRKRDNDKESMRHIYPIRDDGFKQYYASLSLETLSREHGVTNWIDSEFFRAGKKLRIPTNCTDNPGALRMGCNRKNILNTKPFEIDEDFCQKAGEHCRSSTTLFLMHPQFYEIGN